MSDYYLLDDDISTRRILARIIKEEALGEVVGENENPLLAQREILNLQPSIVLIDFLMPFQDGIETVQHLKGLNFRGKFIMISQIENKDMVGKAYEAGIEYFIHKPINKIEVTSVINKLIEQIKMEKSLKTIRESLSLFPLDDKNNTVIKPTLDKIIRDIFTDLGILGENGSSDIMDLMKEIMEHKTDFEKIQLKVLYVDVLKRKNIDPSEKSIKAFEQRIRRAINQALTNLASHGLADFSNPNFELYSSKFFDFAEVRLKMNELDGKKVTRNPRINIRKFLFAFLIEIQGRMEQSVH